MPMTSLQGRLMIFGGFYVERHDEGGLVGNAKTCDRVLFFLFSSYLSTGETIVYELSPESAPLLPLGFLNRSPKTSCRYILQKASYLRRGNRY